MMQREIVKFAGVGGPVVLGAYDTFVYSDAVDCEGFAQVCFELYPDTLVGLLYYTLQFCDDEIAPAGNGGWIADPIEGTAVEGANDTVIPVARAVRTWAANSPVQINSPLPHRFVRIGVAADTSGNCMAIVKRVKLSAQ